MHLHPEFATFEQSLIQNIFPIGEKLKKVLIGNIFDSKAQTLVNTVNCVGIMGRGLALEFKNRFPEMFLDYEQKCKPQLEEKYRKNGSQIEPGLIAIVEMIRRIEASPYHWPIGRTMFQKLTYFATQLWLQTGLM